MYGWPNRSKHLGKHKVAFVLMFNILNYLIILIILKDNYHFDGFSQRSSSQGKFESNFICCNYCTIFNSLIVMNKFGLIVTIK